MARHILAQFVHDLFHCSWLRIYAGPNNPRSRTLRIHLGGRVHIARHPAAATAVACTRNWSRRPNYSRLLSEGGKFSVKSGRNCCTDTWCLELGRRLRATARPSHSNKTKPTGSINRWSRGGGGGGSVLGWTTRLCRLDWIDRESKADGDDKQQFHTATFPRFAPYKWI